MKFDRFDEGFDGEWEDTPGSGKPLVPNGTHPAQITRVKVWQSGEGVTVTLEVDDEQFAPVDLLMSPTNERGHKAAVRLLAALGMEGGEVDDELVGRRVQIVTRQGVNKKDDSKTVYVNGIRPIDGEPQAKPAAPAPAAKKPAARTAAQKIARDAGKEPGGNDDIPF